MDQDTVCHRCEATNILAYPKSSLPFLLINCTVSSPADIFSTDWHCACATLKGDEREARNRTRIRAIRQSLVIKKVSDEGLC